MNGATNRVIISGFKHIFTRIALSLACALAATLALPISAMAVNVTVNAAQDLAIMPSVGLGVGASVYENLFANSSTPGLLQEAGVSAVRYPGGGYADVFHFSASNDEIGSTNGYGMSPWWGNSNSYGYMGYASDFGSFAKGLLQNSGAQGVITINYGAGLQWNSTKTKLLAPSSGASPSEAAAWVAYANGDPSLFGTPQDISLGTDAQGNNWKTVGYWAKLRASTPSQYQTWATPAGAYDSTNSFLAINHSASFGIKYWEIGNETFGTGYYGGGNGYCLDYNVPYDGTNRAGNAALSPARYGTDVVAFSQAMKAVDPTVKIGAVVSTPPGDYSWDTLSGKEWSNEVLAKCANNIDFVIAHWYPWVGTNPDGTSLLAAVPSTLPQMINGTTSGLDTGTSAGIRDWINKYRPTDGNNVQIFITEFGYGYSGTDYTTTSAHACFVADAYATWLDLGVTNIDYQELSSSAFLGDGSTRGDAFYAVSILNKMAKPGDDLVSTTSNGSLLRTHAALQADGTMAVMVINDAIGASTVNVTINGDTMTANGLLYSTNGSQTSALTATAVSNLGNAFTVTVPGRTIYMYLLIPIAQVNAAWNLAGGGSWDTGTNWNWNRAPKSLGDVATLGNSIAAASAALTLDGNRTLSSLTFNNTSGGAYTISPGTSIPSSTLILANQGSSAATVTVSAGNHAITAPVEMDSNVNLSLAAGASLNISSPIGESGAHALTKTGSGILTLSASNSYTGATQINGGILELTSAGQISASSPLSTADGATLQIDAGSHALGNISGSGALNLVSGDLTANSVSQNTITIGAGATLTIAAIPGGPLASSDNLTPVPEPSTLVLLAGPATMFLFGCLQRRQRRAYYV